MSKPKLFSVTINDCRVDTFTVGGNGGGGKDTSNTGVRITHLASGAMGRATDTRSQWANKRLAWRRMGESKEFRLWVRKRAAELDGAETVEEAVEAAMNPKNLLVEVKNSSGDWCPINLDSPYFTKTKK